MDETTEQVLQKGWQGEQILLCKNVPIGQSFVHLPFIIATGQLLKQDELNSIWWEKQLVHVSFVPEQVAQDELQSKQFCLRK